MRQLSVKTLLFALLAVPVAIPAAGVILPARSVAATARAALPAGPPGRPCPVLGSPTGPGEPAATIGLTLPGGRYRVPAACMRYLGHGLNLNLFGAAAMRQAERSGRLDVRISFTGRRPALPGVTIVSSGRGSAAGYLTTASARRFDRALSSRLFAGGVSVGLAGPGAAAAVPAPARPDFPMRTLTVRAADSAGRPDTDPVDSVDVYNVDNSTWFSGDSGYDQGVAKFSVPAGHYWAVALFASPQWHVVVDPQFTVAGPTTIRVAYRDATSKITTSTPRPSGLVSESFEADRAGHAGPPVAEEISISGDGRAYPGAAIWVSPTRRPTIGTLRAYTSEQLGSLSGYRGRPYVYNVAYQDPSGIIAASQRHVVRPASLATVDARYYLDAPAPDSLYGYYALLPGQLGTDLAPEWPFAMPRRQTEYMLTSPSAVWFSSEGEFPFSFVQGGQRSSGEVYRAGEHLDVGWNAFPLHPGYNVNLAGAANPFPALPSASRSGNRLTLDVVPFSDNQPGHTGLGFSAGHYALDENGRQIAAGNALRAGDNNHGVLVRASLRPQPATVRFSLTASRPPRFYPLSGQTRTVWTWRSARGSGTLPPGWACVPPGPFGPAPRADRRCAVQPMLTLRYAVAGLALDGTAPAGRQHITISAGHLPLARAARITGLRLQVSSDGGHRWHPVAVTGRGGQFTARFTAPAGAKITMRTRAADAAGGSVSETITGAYRVAAARAATSLVPSGRLRAACRARPGQERCFAEYLPQASVNAAAAGTPAAAPKGWSPQDLEAAYRLPVSRGAGQTVALSEAYSTPHLAADLARYRRQYGLPPCTQASGCLRIVNQAGRPAPLPASGVPAGWDVETMLDVSMVSAACPHCKILIVEASSPSFGDMAASERTAGRLGAQVISNSYGAPESGFTQAYARSYRLPGHTIVASAGDTGFGPANFPANLASVTAVGGTRLARAATRRGWRETVWNTPDAAGGASGCSAWVPKPPWQHDAHCEMRTVADVAAVAAGVPVYDQNAGGWLTLGGTSVAAPLIAGIYGLAGNAASIPLGYLYRHPASLFDVTAGGNVLHFGRHIVGNTCGGDYLCHAKPGYDAPTGLGTPDGTGAF
jgi:hypothetical protein